MLGIGNKDKGFTIHGAMNHTDNHIGLTQQSMRQQDGEKMILTMQ